MSTTYTVYIGLGGQTTCPTHAGHYLATQIAQRPRRMIETPLDSWLGLTAPEAASEGITCEQCEMSA